MRFAVCAVLLLLCSPSMQAPVSGRIKNFVVLMMENRSFDHLLGFLNRIDKNIEGPVGDETNPKNVSDPSQGHFQISQNAADSDPDPDHSIEGTTFQIFGQNPAPKGSPATMSGFVETMEVLRPGHGVEVMQCFNKSTLPILSTLALEYAVFDRWYSSVPGPTEVNRAYLHSSTSHGMGWNDMKVLLPGLPQRTLYDLFDDSDIDYKFYMEDITTYIFFKQSRHPRQLSKLRWYAEHFAADAAAGTLPTFSFLDPRYYSNGLGPSSDQHPDHSVEIGEKLIKEVYETLRASPQWNETLLMITYDEHGGFYDHVVPPMDGVPNPDGLNTTDIQSPFDFSRLGIRVPTVMISPWIKKGTVVHAPVTGQYEHSSLIATMTKYFNLAGPLTERDKWAATFESIWEELDSPRTDCPLLLPETVTPSYFANTTTHIDGDLPLNSFQQSLLAVAAHIAGKSIDMDNIREFEASKFVMETMRDLMNQK